MNSTYPDHILKWQSHIAKVKPSPESPESAANDQLAILRRDQEKAQKNLTIARQIRRGLGG